MLAQNEIEEAVYACISGDAQAAADIQLFRSAFADPNFLRDRMAELFGPDIPSEYRTGYCRCIQKALERQA